MIFEINREAVFELGSFFIYIFFRKNRLFRKKKLNSCFSKCH